MPERRLQVLHRSGASDLMPSRWSLGASLRRILLKVVPGGWVTAAREARRLDPTARRTWFRLGVSRWLGARRPNSLEPSGTGPVLFICHGNIMRSPMAAALFERQVAGGRKVVSAGMHAIAGKAADSRARALAPEFGVSLEAHAAQPVTAELIQAAALIVVMDRLNEAELLTRFPEAATRTVSLAAYLPEPLGAAGEIPDPYMGNTADARAAFVLVDRAVQNLCRQLAGTPQ